MLCRIRRDKFARECFYIEMQSQNFDYILALMHVVWSGSDPSQRYGEIKRLDDVWKYVQGLNDEQDIILLGDFNAWSSHDAFTDLWDLGLRALIPKRLCTTIGTKNQFSQSYDGFWIDPCYTKELRDHGVHSIDTQTNFKEIRKYVSDHRPIWMVVDTTKDDD